jgi:Ca2+-transporting ATPase
MGFSWAQPLKPSETDYRLSKPGNAWPGDGLNELPRQRKRQTWRIALEVLREPMLALLLVAGGTYLVLGETSEALILILFAGFSIVVTIVQEARTENVLESLRDLSAPRALVVRDGVPIAGRDVVEGDLLVLEQGDRIAADGLLLEAREVESDEVLLTEVGAGAQARGC